MALRFVTTKPKVQWGKVALDAAVGAIFGDVVSNNYSDHAEVQAVNDAGEYQVVETVDPNESAEHRMAVIQGDYDLLTIQAWCEQYNVPITFAEG